jgi:hypothetical protein
VIFLPGVYSDLIKIGLLRTTDISAHLLCKQVSSNSSSTKKKKKRKKSHLAGHKWHMLLVPSIGETEAGGCLELKTCLGNIVSIHLTKIIIIIPLKYL